MTAPGEGFGVRPEELRAGAVALRGDAEALVAAGRAASAAVTSVGGACGVEPLVTAVARFGHALDGAVGAVSARVGDAAASLDASATAYVADDQGAAGGLGAPDGGPAVVLPGLGGP
ncbi:type VII secretion target [Actinomycetospora straminea]|uniref:Excreted virulence factor EspC (Type VII ESX diderm) n=1 Tax=Actinomycetospora straminea TaxID=663607 RepID=A0ABP9EQE3_9PSEU|nr:type VII secretion target [Actinomycetospora straminea]MDD7935435.1 type VII secretion target [Actinomycetospora straminea]